MRFVGVKIMKKFSFIFYILVICWYFGDAFAQSYPPVTPPSVKSRGSIFVDNEEPRDNRSDLLKKVNTLEANINNFVPMLMKNSSDINKMRDNADSLIIDLKQQLNDLKHSVKVYDLRLLDVMERLDKLENKKDMKSSVEYVKNPLDLELNKKDDNDKNKNTKTSKDVKNGSAGQVANPDIKNNQQKTNQTQNSIRSGTNINIPNLQEQPTYHDPLARNQIHIPNL